MEKEKKGLVSVAGLVKRGGGPSPDFGSVRQNGQNKDEDDEEGG